MSNQQNSVSNNETSANPHVNSNVFQPNRIHSQMPEISIDLSSNSIRDTTPLLVNNRNAEDEIMSNNLHQSRANPMSSFRLLTREVIDRRSIDRPRNWRDNLNNVIQGIRPLVQQAESVNNFSSWLPTTGRQLRYNDNIGNVYLPQQVSGHPVSNFADSFVINLDSQQANSSSSDIFGPTNRVEPPVLRQIYNNQNHIHHLGTDNRGHVEPVDNLITAAAGTTSAANEPGHIGIRRNPSQNHHHHHHHHHHHANNENENEGPVTEAFAQIPEARAFLNTLNRYTPYIFILLAKSCYDHLDGIVDFFALFMTFSHANWIVRQEIAKKHQKEIIPLLRELIYIVLVIAIVGFMLEKKNIYISLMFATSFTEPFTLRNLLFSVGITDLILKLITVGVKIIITLLPTRIIEYKGRGRIYLMTESISQLYRALAPIQPWLVYLLESYSGYEKIMGVILSAAYMVAKGTDLLNRAKFVKRSFIKMLQNVSFGQTPTKEQQQTAGGQCPICHDNYNSPVMLECNHIFCELCVGTWFDREQTCPLCRAKVVDDPSWRDGATTFFVQFY